MTTSKHKDLTGVVLIGGKSQRMGKDKSMIVYHGIPQYQHLYQLLSEFCKEVYLSCSAAQADKIGSSFKYISDSKESQGPLEGIRSAFEQIETSLLIVPCDMPSIDQSLVSKLVQSRDSDCDAVCFQDAKGFINPLVAIWETSCIAKLKHFDGDSPNQFLKMVKAKILKLDSGELKNINTPSELNNYFKNQG